MTKSKDVNDPVVIEITRDTLRVEIFKKLLFNKYSSILQLVFVLSCDERDDGSFLCLISSNKETFPCRFINSISLKQLF